jgi:hypothetical protein
VIEHSRHDVLFVRCVAAELFASLVIVMGHIQSEFLSFGRGKTETIINFSFKHLSNRKK